MIVIVRRVAWLWKYSFFCRWDNTLLTCFSKRASDSGDEDDDEVEAEEAPRTKDRDYVAIAVLLCLYFGNMFVLSIFETIGLPLTMDEFSWSPADVRERVGL